MTSPTDIDHWRSQIFARLITIVLVLGLVTAVPSIAIAVRGRMWPMIGVILVSLAWLVGVRQLTGLSHRARVLNFIAIVFFSSIGLMASAGHVAQIFLIAPPVFASLLLGMRPALVALAISALAMLVLGLSGLAPLNVPGFTRSATVPAILSTLNFLFVGSLITITCGTLLDRLAQSLTELRLFAASLEEGKDALHAVNANLRLSAAALAQLNDKVLITHAIDADGDLDQRQPIIFANDAFLRRTGFTRDELLGRSLASFIGPENDPARIAHVVNAMARGEGTSAELQVSTKSGERYWIEMDVVPFRDEQGTHTHWVVIARDIDERRKAATAIHRLAYYDVLTGLPNRRFLMERLDERLTPGRDMRRSDRPGTGGALLFIDLDHFKYVNDARGHATGDGLLRTAAQRLSSLVGDGDTVARIGGDEFVVLLCLDGSEAEVAAAAMAKAHAIRAAVSREMEIDGNTYTTSASVGVALITHPEQSATDLLRDADTAMYRAKAGGRNGVALFEKTMRAEVEERLTLERALGRALERRELFVHLQLQFDTDARPTGAELLMRWRRGDGRMVPPDVFIPVAEATGLIVPLGQWVLRQACLSWLQLDAAGYPMPLSVNVSPSQFRQPDFVAMVQRVLAQYKVPPGQIILEVTEGLVVGNGDVTIARMQELAALGLRFSIDDFGTGYSNLAYLKRMPLYELKIDKGFIRDIPGDPDGTAIICSIMAMAAHLRLRVVAEGVETREQAAFLAANGAPHMQGYLFARPAPLAEVLELLGQRANGRAWGVAEADVA